MNKLIWELFEMIRDLVPPTRENTLRLAKWAAEFHALDAPPSDAAIGLEHESHEELDPEHEAELRELENEGGHSHIEIEHTRGAPPRRKKRK